MKMDSQKSLEFMSEKDARHRMVARMSNINLRSTGIMSFLPLSFQSSLCILNRSLLSGICFAKIFCQSVAVFSFSLQCLLQTRHL